MTASRRFTQAALTALVLLAPSRAPAQYSNLERIDLNADPNRASAMAEAGVGLLALPGAAICSNLSCTKGDRSLMLEAWQLIRPRPKFGLGAGMTLGLLPASEAPPEQPLNPEDDTQPASHIVREHTRGYFNAQAVARFYPFTAATAEAWLGVTTGLVVVTDTFGSAEAASDKAYVGPRGVTLRSEGFTLGLATGGAYALGRNWFAGGTFRYSNWFLPQNPQTSAFGDEASLTGRVSVFHLALTLAYRVGL